MGCKVEAQDECRGYPNVQVRGDDGGSGQGQKQYREVAVSGYVPQVKLTGMADGLDGAGKPESAIKEHS